MVAVMVAALVAARSYDRADRLSAPRLQEDRHHRGLCDVVECIRASLLLPPLLVVYSSQYAVLMPPEDL